MQTNTDKRTMLDLTIEARRRRAQGAVDEFRIDAEKNGIAHAISWGSVPAIVGEMVLDALSRFDYAVAEHGVERAVEMTAEVRENVARQVGYFDPTSHSTSASAVLTSGAEFQGHRAVYDLLDEIQGSHAMDVEG